MSSFLVIKIIGIRITSLKMVLQTYRIYVISELVPIYYSWAFLQIIYVDRLILMTKIGLP